MVPVHAGQRWAPKWSHFSSKEGEDWRGEGNWTSPHSWHMVEQGHVCLTQHYFASLLPCQELSAGDPHISLLWWVFECFPSYSQLNDCACHGRGWFGIKSVWPLSPLWTDQTVVAGDRLCCPCWLTFDTIAVFLHLGLCTGPSCLFPEDISGSLGSFAFFPEFDLYCQSRFGFMLTHHTHYMLPLFPSLTWSWASGYSLLFHYKVPKHQTQCCLSAPFPCQILFLCYLDLSCWHFPP